MADEPFEPVEIVGVDTPNVGTPRNDGTRGSGLYRVPIKLNRRPPGEWAAAFPQAWDRPPEFTTMHRPGIASVSGGSISLDGTTVEEVRDYHARTPTLVVTQLNEAQARSARRSRAPLTRTTSAPSSITPTSSSTRLMPPAAARSLDDSNLFLVTVERGVPDRWTMIGDLQLQLVQPGAGSATGRFPRTAWQRHLSDRLAVDSVDAAEAQASALGLDVLLRGRRPDGSGFSYFDTYGSAGVTLQVRRAPAR